MRSSELIGERQNQHHEHLLVVRLYRKNVAADALRRPWLVQQSVPLYLLNRARNSTMGNWLQFEFVAHDGTLVSSLRLDRGCIFLTGSICVHAKLSLTSRCICDP